ncbi:hypothetical protein DTW90_20170 [Neorhizobium sp. P12A]|nr:hypothetical protein DTW90_20170 [Neorhizobium sp. P12A]
MGALDSCDEHRNEGGWDTPSQTSIAWPGRAGTTCVQNLSPHEIILQRLATQNGAPCGTPFRNFGFAMMRKA